jgi:hypothetical protein
LAYTFGATTTDALSAGLGIGSAGNSSPAFVCGWFNPSTLTATRRYFSFGTTCGVEVDTTTSELRITTQNATTNGVWTTSGAGIVTSKWQFIAVLFNCNNTGPAATITVWVGDQENRPAAITVNSATAPVGNFTSTSTLFIGNLSAGSVAFQGDIENLTYLAQSAVGVSTLFSIATAGTTTATEQQFILERIVLPRWLSPSKGSFRAGRAIVNCDETVFPLDLSGQGIRRFDGASTFSNVLVNTVGSAAISQARGPRRAFRRGGPFSRIAPRNPRVTTLSPTVSVSDSTPEHLQSITLTIANFSSSTVSDYSVFVGSVQQAVTGGSLSGGAGTLTFTYTRGSNAIGTAYALTVKVLGVTVYTSPASITPSVRVGYNTVTLAGTVLTNPTVGLANNFATPLTVGDLIEWKTPVGDTITVNADSSVAAGPSYVANTPIKCSGYIVASGTWQDLTFALNGTGTIPVTAAAQNARETLNYMHRARAVARGR